ncbi:hypothetical protein [Streptomyces sp. NPDC059575]|uniref:hypothetical protein n=1 Tax=Streptomyces sp. NPDC059575 TaxID=3346872 RepID=UPI0036BA349A
MSGRTDSGTAPVTAERDDLAESTGDSDEETAGTEGLTGDDAAGEADEDTDEDTDGDTGGAGDADGSDGDADDHPDDAPDGDGDGDDDGDDDDEYDEARRARWASVLTGAVLCAAGAGAALFRLTGAEPALVPAAYALGAAVCALAGFLGSRGRTRRALWLLVAGTMIMALGDQFD